MSITLTGKTIGQLTTLTGITEDTVFPVELSGTTYKISYSNIPHFKYEIGEYVQSEGGVIYHRYKSGNTQYYLVVDTQDLGQAFWSNINNASSGAISLWDGQSNTNTITTQSGATSGAAFLCAASTNNGKSDWYLPAIQELIKLRSNMLEVSQGIDSAGGTQFVFTSGYWSSTEFSSSNAGTFTFFSGGASNVNKGNTYYVRAVRKFTL